MLATLSNATSAFTNISSFLKLKHEKNMILDPLTSIIRISILSFKEDGTKISINNNKISYCPPGLFQGTIRLAYGDNREDLHNLYNPIIKATEWFEPDKIIRNLFIHSIQGLKLLRKSYSKNSTIYHTLRLYQDLLKYKLNNNSINKQDLTTSCKLLVETKLSHKKKKYRKKNNKNRNNYQGRANVQDRTNAQDNTNVCETDYASDHASTHNTLIDNVSNTIEDNMSDTTDSDTDEVEIKKEELSKIYIKLRKLWNKRELEIVNNLILELKDKQKSKIKNKLEIDALFNALDLILNVKENMVSKILLEETTIL